MRGSRHGFSLVHSKMWDWRQLRWVNKFGWWPKAAKTKYGQQMSRYWGLFLFAFDFLQLIPEFIALYTIINEGSLKGTVANLTTTLLGVLCAARVYFLIEKSDEISLLVDSFAELDSNILLHALGAEGKTIMANGDRQCKKITYTLVFAVISLLHWLLRPLILLLTHNIKTTIIDIWVPWSFDNLGGWSAIYFIQIVHVLSAVLGSIMFDSLFFCFSEMLITQLSLLSFALTKIDFRKTHTIKLNRDVQAEDIELITLDKCIEFHCKLLSMVKVITQIYDVIQILQFVSLAAVVCLSIFEASSMEGVTLIKVINLIEMMITFMFFMFMYCYYSTMLVEKCQEIGRSAYMNNWYEGCLKDKKRLLMIIERSKKAPRFGMFLNVNLDTFITLLKSAFSYYNVLKAFITD